MGGTPRTTPVEPAGTPTYCAAAIRLPASPNGWAPRGVPHVCAEVDGALVFLAEVTGTAALTAALPDLGTEPVGIGAVRAGAAGAAETVRDALTVLALGRPGVVRFDDAWHLATLAESRPRLQPVWDAAGEVADKNGHLAAAVLAFADGDLSVVTGARALHIHPNTMIYRLERWKALTGWDARTFDGLARSVACLRARSSA